MTNKLFKRAKRQALAIMAKVYDPFHDDHHVLAVENSATAIYKRLNRKIKNGANLELIRLACLFHDTSRKIIKTNIFLQPFLEGYLSGRIAYKTLIQVGYDEKEAYQVKKIINDHEIILGLVKRKPDINCRIFSDADVVEGYSVDRLDRGLRRFEKKQFSKLLLNLYVVGLVTLHNKWPPICNFSISEELKSQNIGKLGQYLLKNRKRIKAMLYRRVYRYLYSIDFLS